MFAMKQIMVGVFVISALSSGLAQTAAKPAAPRAGARPAAASGASTGVKLPPGVPAAHGIVKTAFSLRYQDVRIGTGAEAEPNKLYKVQYTGWLATDGHKFDSSYDHKGQVLDKDGKPELDADGKPKMEAQPLSFPQGFGRVIPGFDQGFTGMHVGGKRRLFIPWQLAYGARGRPGPSAANPGIPAKADLIFDIELVDQSDLEMQMPQGHSGMGQPTRGVPHFPAGATKPSDQATPPPAGTTETPSVPPPAGTPPPSTPPTSTPPGEKPQ
jgi:peptidylprolyl isomerase